MTSFDNTTNILWDYATAAVDKMCGACNIYRETLHCPSPSASLKAPYEELVNALEVQLEGCQADLRFEESTCSASTMYMRGEIDSFEAQLDAAIKKLESVEHSHKLWKYSVRVMVVVVALAWLPWLAKKLGEGLEYSGLVAIEAVTVCTCWILAKIKKIFDHIQSYMAACKNSITAQVAFLALTFNAVITVVCPGVGSFLRGVGKFFSMLLRYVVWPMCFVLAGFLINQHLKEGGDLTFVVNWILDIYAFMGDTAKWSFRVAVGTFRLFMLGISREFQKVFQWVPM